jgi:hypothetical protein
MMLPVLILVMCFRLIAFGEGLSIYLLVHERPRSTHFCLETLASVRSHSTIYPNRKIDLHVHIDPLSNGTVHAGVASVVNKFNWPHGEKVISAHPRQVGIAQQWLNIRPSEVAFVVEDDVRVTPHYYEVIEGIDWSDTELFAASLQRPQWQQGINEKGKWRRLDRMAADHPAVFKFKAPGTWGLVIHPARWEQFTRWVQMGNPTSYTEGAITTKWLRERGQQQLISPLMFEFIMEHELFIQYYWLGNPNYVLATSQLEGVEGHGSNVSAYAGEMVVQDFACLSKVLAAQMMPRIPSFTACMDLVSFDARGAAQAVSIDGKRSIACQFVSNRYPDPFYLRQ